MKTTLAITAIKSLCLPARGMPHLPRSGGLVATSSSHSDPLSLKLYKTRVLKWFAEQMKNFTKQPTWYDKDIGNHSFLNSSRSPFSSYYCDANSWLFDTNTVSVQLTAVFNSSRTMLRLNSYFIFNIIF